MVCPLPVTIGPLRLRETAVLRRRLPRVAGYTEALQVVRVEPPGVVRTIERDNVVDVARRHRLPVRFAVCAEWERGQVRRPELLPRGVVPAGPRSPTTTVEPLMPCLVTRRAATDDEPAADRAPMLQSVRHQ